ncbi:MAG: CorA family divalent cation transporter [Candidatus Hodarchaeales archaeon]|jgi:Mg2+ and Co2+ transporter CorA
MIWAYSLSREKFLPQDVSSIDEVEELAKNRGWVWVDCVDPDDKELQMIAKLLESQEVIDIIKSQKILSSYEKINGHVLIQLVLVEFSKKLETHPLYVFANEHIMITVRTEQMSGPIKSTLDILQDCFKKVKCETSSSFVVSRLFHDVVGENLNVIVELRDHISEIEQRALEESSNKNIDEIVFKLKREITKFERILWVQREIMLALEEGVVPSIQPTKIDKQALNHTIRSLSRELSLISSHSSALDSVLTVRGLGIIHRVETNLIYLTIILVMLTAILIGIEVDIFRLLFG